MAEPEVKNWRARQGRTSRYFETSTDLIEFITDQPLAEQGKYALEFYQVGYGWGPAGRAGVSPPPADTQLLRMSLSVLKRMACQFWACEGFDEEPKEMVTCARCSTIYEILQQHPEWEGDVYGR